jgi:hypothetical protein
MAVFRHQHHGVVELTLAFVRVWVNEVFQNGKFTKQFVETFDGHWLKFFTPRRRPPRWWSRQRRAMCCSMSLITALRELVGKNDQADCVPSLMLVAEGRYEHGERINAQDEYARRKLAVAAWTVLEDLLRRYPRFYLSEELAHRFEQQRAQRGTAN